MDPSNLEPVLAKDSELLVAAFYAFTPLDDERREALLTRLPTLARESSVLGSVLVAVSYTDLTLPTIYSV